MSELRTEVAEVTLVIDGHDVVAPPHMTVVQALWRKGIPRVAGLGCLEGVCGSCRVLVRRREQPAQVALACQTLVEQDMQVVFLPPPAKPRHHYQLDEIGDSWDLHARFAELFPETARCRHCHGCTLACPKGIAVEHGVELAADGRFTEAGEVFLECILCDLCVSGCPEDIAPSQVGIFCRRVTAHFHARPSNLIRRLEELRRQRVAHEQSRGEP